jgi:hypothetical protein
MMSRRTAAATLAACFAVLAGAGCAAPTTVEEKPAWPPARFIVKPRAAVASEAQIVALVRAQLRQPERVRLFRPMSGGAFVFEVVPPGTRDDLGAIVSTLSESGVFEYVEVDAPVTIR